MVSGLPTSSLPILRGRTRKTEQVESTMSRQTTAKRLEMQIEGFPEDGGAVRLDALYSFLAEVRKTLSAVEREVTGEEKQFVA